MTRKDVIENLKNKLNDLHNGYQTYLEHGGKQDIETENDIEALNMAIETLKEPERKKGQWVDGESKCPVCGEDKFKNLDADIWADWKPPFCPNCGADMRGEEE